MGRDTSLQLRQAVITELRADDTLTAIGEPPIAARIYGMRTPSTLTWPFTRYGAPSAVPLRAQCLNGAVISFTVHSFSKGQFEDECADMNSAIVAALDHRSLELDADYDAMAHIRWVGSQIIPDAAEASAWHGVNSFEATVAS